MNTDRRAILSLVAMGRITPRDAERLLAVWPGGEDKLARLALCLAFAWLVLSHLDDVCAGLSRTLLAIAPGIHHALAYVMHGIGGLR
jgi:hypothetical protein